MKYISHLLFIFQTDFVLIIINTGINTEQEQRTVSPEVEKTYKVTLLHLSGVHTSRKIIVCILRGSLVHVDIFFMF